MKISVIICGLVRDSDRFCDKLQQFYNWTKEGFVDEVIYSTWIGELASYPAVKAKLNKTGVKVIEVEEPRLVLKGGHQLHQMTSLYYAINEIEDEDKYVLKTRVDLADNHADMLHEFTSGTEATDDFLGVGLKNKIIVENSQLLYPFLQGDAQFYGKKSDIAKLVNLSNEMEVVYNRLAVEQTFFFEPFKNIEIFKTHFYWNLPHISDVAHRRDEQLDFLSKSTYMRECIEAWWIVLDAYFKIGWAPRFDFVKYGEIKDFISACNYVGDEKFIGGDKSDVIACDSFVKSLMKSFSPERIESLKQRMQRAENKGPFGIKKNVFEEYEEFRLKFSDLPSPKACLNKGNNTLKVKGAAQHFFVKDQNDQASSRYHEQVTMLRRENDFLKKQLNISYSNTVLHRILNRVMPRRLIEFCKYRMPNLTGFYAKYFMKKVD
tara:strand:+ start:4271 stop:5572 length:1302 start_codon:yes stop_codon:yes gene_type:complete